MSSGVVRLPRYFDRSSEHAVCYAAAPPPAQSHGGGGMLSGLGGMVAQGVFASHALCFQRICSQSLSSAGPTASSASTSLQKFLPLLALANFFLCIAYSANTMQQGLTLLLAGVCSASTLQQGLTSLLAVIYASFAYTCRYGFGNWQCFGTQSRRLCAG